jgi:hypothetical protein
MAILTPAPANFQQKIRSQLAEALQLGYADIIPSILHMRVALAGTTIVNKAATVLPTSASDIFRVGGDYNFLIGEIRAHLALNSVSAEETGGDFNGFMADTSVRGRMIAKAANAKVSLFNADRNDLRFVENNIQNSSVGGPLISDLALSTILPLAGGSAIKLINQGYVMPLIVPGNERLQMRVSLTNAAASTGATEYGLTCIGALVRMRAG